MSIIKPIIAFSLILAIGGVTYSILLADPAEVAANAKYVKVLALDEAEVIKAEAALFAARLNASATIRRRDSLVAQYTAEYRAARGYTAPATVAGDLREKAELAFNDIVARF